MMKTNMDYIALLACNMTSKMVKSFPNLNTILPSLFLTTHRHYSWISMCIWVALDLGKIQNASVGLEWNPRHFIYNGLPDDSDATRHQNDEIAVYSNIPHIFLLLYAMLQQNFSCVLASAS